MTQWTEEQFKNYKRTLLAKITLYPRIPLLQRESLVEFITEGRPTGSFLHAVLINDLMKAVNRGDDENQLALHEYVKFLCNHAPALCFGDEERVETWKKSEGIKGIFLRESEQIVRVAIDLSGY